MTTDGRRLYNSRIVDNYIRLIAQKYPEIQVSDLLEYAGMTAHEVADEGHWFTQDQIDRFHKKLSVLTCNTSISREAGRYAASPGAMGAMKLFFLGIGRTRQGLRADRKRRAQVDAFLDLRVAEAELEQRRGHDHVRAGRRGKALPMREPFGFLGSDLPALRSHPAGHRTSRVHLPGRKGMPVQHLLARVESRPVQASAQLRGSRLLPLAILSALYAPLFGLTQLLPAAMAILAVLTSLCLWLDKKDMAA
jgi:hypothetical protein